MNANELVKILESDSKHTSGRFTYSSRYIADIATMLRQQQAREDSLCSMVKEYQDKVDELRTEIEALKAHPVKELNDGGEPVKNATYWKRQYNLMATQNDNLKSGLYHANEQIKYFESQIEALKKKLNEAIDAEKDRRFE